MACANVDMDIHVTDERPGRANRRQLPEPVVRVYKATVMKPEDTGPLHDLLQRDPAVLGSLQMACGFLSVGVGIVFAFTLEMTQSLFTLFRVAHLTGVLFIVAGLLSTLLHKYPQLLFLSFKINCGCITVAVVAACLIIADLANWNAANEQQLKIEVLALCVMGLEVFLSAVLCFWFSREKRVKSP